MKKSIIGLLWGESTLKVMAILYDSVITAFLLQFGLKNTQIGLLWSVVLLSSAKTDVVGTIANASTAVLTSSVLFILLP